MSKHAKTPIKTRTKILKIAENLFNTQGFESTKIQDILAHLTRYGLTKGAFYHHFADKEALLYALLACHREGFSDVDSILSSHTNGRDKLKAIILHHLAHTQGQAKLIRQRQHLLQASPVLAYYNDFAQHTLAPLMESLIELGNYDGSLNAAYSKPASEILAWGVYVWLDVALYPLDEKSYTHKLRHFRIMCEGIGLSVIDEEITKAYVGLWQGVHKE